MKRNRWRRRRTGSKGIAPTWGRHEAPQGLGGGNGEFDFAAGFGENGAEAHFVVSLGPDERLTEAEGVLYIGREGRGDVDADDMVEGVVFAGVGVTCVAARGVMFAGFGFVGL